MFEILTLFCILEVGYTPTVDLGGDNFQYDVVYAQGQIGLEVGQHFEVGVLGRLDTVSTPNTVIAFAQGYGLFATLTLDKYSVGARYIVNSPTYAIEGWTAESERLDVYVQFDSRGTR